MRQSLLLLSATFLMAVTSQAQQVIIDFEYPALPKIDTFYVNFDQPGEDVGFTYGGAHFQCVFDTAFGGTWLGGFTVSSMQDSVTSGFGNQYAAKTAEGAAGSYQYMVYYDGYGFKPKAILLPPSILNSSKTASHSGTVVGFYVTNSTYAYNSMRNGDFVGKKFGGIDGSDPDWYKLTIYGYHQGVLKPDSVEFYLADFRSPDPADDYIVNTWEWVNLLPLGVVDSLEFHLSSSDIGQWGINTPTYFCMDNFAIDFTLHVTETSSGFDAKVYPNPAYDVIYVESGRSHIEQIQIYDITGRVMMQVNPTSSKTQMDISQLPSGNYILLVQHENKTASARFVKP